MVTHSIRVCKKHGESDFRKRSNRDQSWVCCACAYAAIRKRRYKLHTTIIEEHGGCCIICGYDKNYAGLCFHHRNPADKKFGIRGGSIMGIDKLRKEAKKCDLLCHNCHAELHNPRYVRNKLGDNSVVESLTDN